MKGDKKMRIQKKIKSRQARGLGKYDAPLFIQYKKGITSFIEMKHPLIRQIQCNIENGQGVGMLHMQKI